MRNETEVIDSILSVAFQDDAVRAVVRTNLLPERECIHSYEFYFVVDDISKFDNDIFKDAFGEKNCLPRCSI